MAKVTGITAVHGKTKTADYKLADYLFFNIELMRDKAGLDEPLSDDGVLDRCTAIARKMEFLGDVIRSTKFDGMLVAFKESKQNSDSIDDIAIPQGC